MKLRRALVTAAATAAIAPVVLLSAPTAFATETASPSPSDSSSQTASASATETGGESTPDTFNGASPSGSQSETSQTSTGTPTGTPSGSSSSSSSSSTTPSATESDDEFDPATDCTDIELDDKITASLKGLPSKIVAGSGWHDFSFEVTNETGRDLDHVWVDAFAEYADDTDTLLNDGLAELQVKEDGEWTSSYQDSYTDEDGKKYTASSSFVAVIDDLNDGDTATLDLRVKIGAKAPAGATFAMSDALYVGEKSQCFFNADAYDVTILAAGGDAGDVDDAKPNGDKPTDIKAQGKAEEISGHLASTGSSSALPIVGLVGGAAVVAGAGAIFVARRRRTGSHV